MKRRHGLTRRVVSSKGVSTARTLAVVTCLLAGLTVALAFVLVLPGCAPETNGGYPPGAHGAAMQAPALPGVYEIMTHIDVTPEQLPAVRAVLEQAEDARESVREDMASRIDGGRPDSSALETMRAQMSGVNESTEEQLQELLTSEQMTDYREMMQRAERQRDEARSQAGGRRGGPGGGKGGRSG